MNTLSRSWELIGESFAIIRKDKKLILFPILSGLAMLAIAAIYFVPLLALGVFKRYAQSHAVDPSFYAWLFLWYCTSYFVMIFFNCALAACAQIRFSGGEPTLGAGLGQAAAKLPSILMWAVVASTVGVILHVIADRSSWLGKIVSSLLGIAWAVATYLIVPVLVFEEDGVFRSLQRSSALLRKTWGEQIVSGFGFGVPWLLLAIPGILLGVIAARLHPLGVVVVVPYFLLLSAVMSAVRGIFAVALYRYATEGEAPPGFSRGNFKDAFIDKSERD
ncbi:MAG: hypothetical protein JWO19_398 [Bryobacterales bacterium]|nr:hypothetical protein [Bryobacterales bacterium]